MNTLEELLPGIEEFLCTDLSTEELTVKAERKRQFFVERLEVLRLQQPPNVPPRPERLAKSPKLPLASSSPRSKVPTDSLAALRELSRSNVSTDNSASLNNSKEEEDIYEEFENPSEVEPESNEVESSKVNNSENDKPCPTVSAPVSVSSDIVTEDDWYEVPLEQLVESPSSKTPVEDPQLSDRDSGTSYESYDEEEVDASMNNAIYQNQAPSENIKLPVLTRVKNKKKKKSSSKEDLLDLSVSDLQNIQYSGELFHCGTFSWSKRFCVINDNHFLCYKSDKDNKPLLNFPLEGCTISYIDKEGKRNNIVKISHDGSKTALFSAENKDKIETWIQHLKKAALLADSAESISKADGSNSQCSDVSGGQTATSQPTEKVTKSTSSISCASSSEGGSGDGSAIVDGGKTPNVSAPSPYDTKEYISSKERRRISKQGSEMPSLEKSFQKAAQWFGTFGRKKGEKKRSIFYAVEVCDFMESNPEVDMAGYVKILTDLGGPKKWCKRFCYIKNGSFICRKEISDEVEDFSLRLSGCEVGDAHETKKELAVKVLYGGHDKFIIEPADALEQGNWLSILIRETGCAKLYTKRPLPQPIPDFANSTGEFDQEYENIEVPAGLESGNITVAEVNPCNMEANTADTDMLNEVPSTDDLYEEVYQNSSENVMAFLENSYQGNNDDDHQRSPGVNTENNEGTSLPPPLPKSDPPPRPKKTMVTEEPINRSEDYGAEDWYDDIEMPEEIDLDIDNTQNKEEQPEQASLCEDEGEDNKNNIEARETAGVTHDTTENQCRSESNNVNSTDIDVSNTQDEKCSVEVECDDSEHTVDKSAVDDSKHAVDKPAGDDNEHAVDKPAVDDSEHSVDKPAVDDSEHSVDKPAADDSEHVVNKPAPDDSGQKSRSSSISSTPDEEVAKEELSSLRRKILQTRKKRADLRAKKLQARKPSDKEAIESEIRMIDKDLKSWEEELQKLQEAAGSPRKPVRVRSQKKNSATMKGSAAKQTPSVKTAFKTITVTTKNIQTVNKQSNQNIQKSNGHKPSQSERVKLDQSRVETENENTSSEELRPIVKERLKLWENMSEKNQSNC